MHAPRELKCIFEDWLSVTFIGAQQNSTNNLNASSEVLIGSKKYIVERHFTGKRDLQQAVFSVVENEAKRDEPAKKSA